jgi:hypothetical protein
MLWAFAKHFKEGSAPYAAMFAQIAVSRIRVCCVFAVAQPQQTLREGVFLYAPARDFGQSIRRYPPGRRYRVAKSMTKL